MPELPEVETTCRGLAANLVGETIVRLDIREYRLRWPVEPKIVYQSRGRRFRKIERRAKYLLLAIETGTYIIHLGMSGRLTMVDAKKALHPHEHLVWYLDSGRSLRFQDHRRFGSVFFTHGDPLDHPRLCGLGPEPLSNEFDGALLYALAKGRRIAVKAFIMDPKIVVGVGNIYATEALHRAGIDPRRAAGRVSLLRMERLAEEIQTVLDEAIRSGGTSLRDYVGSDGVPGAFKFQLKAYGREGEPCLGCGNLLASVRLGQRASAFCRSCQR